jgi:hypothetical protein
VVVGAAAVQDVSRDHAGCVPKSRQLGVRADPLSVLVWVLGVNCLDLGTGRRPDREAVVRNA